MNKKTRRRVPLALKLNRLIVSIIFFVAVGLMLISYFVHGRQVDRFYYDLTERAALTVRQNVDPDSVSTLWKAVNTDEFRNLREKAVAANDEQMIIDWMETKPSSYGEAAENFSLWDEYSAMLYQLEQFQDIFEMKSVFLQYDYQGNTYNLADASEGILYLGSIEQPLDAFSDYADNAYVPATVYHSVYGWLCTSCAPVGWEGEDTVGFVGADKDMNEIVEERNWFLLNSVIFILLVTAAGIVCSILVINRIATVPLHQLQEGTCGFIQGKDGYTMDDVIDLKLSGNDEITDLYDEIRSMQTHIVHYTQDLTHITAEKERIRTELDLAAKIQQAMLPKITAEFRDRQEFSLLASMDPAKDVGGDFYDFFFLDENRLVLVIADVSGKGIPASLFMSVAKNMIGTRAATGGTPSEILTAVNAQICKNNSTHMFVTVWLGILDLQTGLLTAANAGHEDPAVRGKNGVFRLWEEKHGFVLGGLKSTRYKDYSITLAPGDALFLYTDGVTEATDTQEQLFGTERMLDALNKPGLRTPEEMLRIVRQHIDSFVGEAEQFDDLTMLCLVYNGRNPESELSS